VKTKIVCTLGPSVEFFNDFMSFEVNNGMSFARINTAHGDFSSSMMFF
jgi:pyruvate kinase